MRLVKPIIHPKCYTDESPVGYLWRLAELNRYDSYRWLVVDDQKTGHKRLGELYTLLLQNPWTGFTQEHPFHDHYRNTIRYLNPLNLKICPKCVKAKGYWDYKVHLPLSPICTEHKIWKIDSCTACNKPQLWRTGNFKNCSCGAPRTQKIEKASITNLDLTAFLEGKPVAGRKIPLDASEFTYKKRCDLVILFVVFLDRPKKPGQYQRFSSIESSKKYWIDVSNILLGEEKYFVKFIDSLHRNNSNDFEDFYRKFLKFKQASLMYRRSVVIDYIVRELKKTVSKRNASFFHDRPIIRYWSPLQTVAKKFSVPKSVLKQLIKMEKLYHWVDSLEKRNRTMVYIESPDELYKLTKNYISFDDAKDKLGVTKLQLRRILQEGILEDICKPDCHYSKWLISSCEIEEFLKSLHAKTYFKETNKNTITISDALSYYSKGISDLLIILLNSIINGELSVRSRQSPKGVRAITLDKEKFLEWRLDKLNNSGSMTIVALAKRFGINQEAMYQIINVGLLKTHDKGKNRKNRVVAEDDINSFKEKYVLLSKLASVLGRSPKSLKAEIEGRKIQTICQRLGIQLRQTVYLRSDISKYYPAIEKDEDWQFDVGTVAA